MANERPLGTTQRAVLWVMIQGQDQHPSGQSAPELLMGLPSFEKSSVRGAVDRLYLRGLIDVSGWDNRNARTYKLTRKGVELAKQIWEGEEEPEL